jgi:hypothetical protein
MAKIKNKKITKRKFLMKELSTAKILNDKNWGLWNVTENVTQQVAVADVTVFQLIKIEKSFLFFTFNSPQQKLNWNSIKHTNQIKCESTFCLKYFRAKIVWNEGYEKMRIEYGNIERTKLYKIPAKCDNKKLIKIFSHLNKNL